MPEMPLRYVRSYNATVWKAAGIVWWSQRGRILIAEVLTTLVLAGVFAVTGYDAIGWSVGLSVLVLCVVAGVWLLVLGVRESAERDWTQSRMLEQARGELTDEEVRQAQRDRKILQRKAFKLLTMIHNTGIESMGSPGPERGQAIWDALGEVIDTAIQTDHATGEEYYDIAHVMGTALDGVQNGMPTADLEFKEAFEALGKLELRDREWVMKWRKFNPPLEAPPTPKRR